MSLRSRRFSGDADEGAPEQLNAGQAEPADVVPSQSGPVIEGGPQPSQIRLRPKAPTYYMNSSNMEPAHADAPAGSRHAEVAFTETAPEPYVPKVTKVDINQVRTDTQHIQTTVAPASGQHYAVVPRTARRVVPGHVASVPAEPVPAVPKSPTKIKVRSGSRRRARFKVGFAALAAVAVLTVGGLVAIKLTGSSPASAPAQAKIDDAAIISQATQLAGITTGEVPVLLKVLDKTKVEQPFLDAAENDDRVLLFYTARKVVLYRPSSNQIVKTGNFVPPAPKLWIREGSMVKAADKVKNALKADRDYIINSTDQSAHLDYADTLVLDLSGHYKEAAEKLAAKLGAKVVSNIPGGESTPEADILVITGKSQK